MEKGQISVQTENIFPIIKKFLYSDQEIFLRELVSNAVDATNKLQTLARTGSFDGELGELKIEVLLDEDAKTLTIRDRGVGMTGEEVKKYLNQVAFSSAQEFLEKYKDDEASIIGHFGLGFYSAFMVAKKVEVVTKSYQADAEGVTWTCEGDPSFTLENNDKDTRGTDVVLHITDDSAEFLSKSRIEDLLKKYCAFLPIPIQFGTREETVTEGEGDEAETKTVTVDNFINNTDPAWRKSPADLTDEDYRHFYHELYPFSQEPLFWIHLNIDYPFNLTGILYFPRLNNSLEVQQNKIQLYSNQVYVTDNVKDIVPEFLTLLHGVIDSPDIPLNVSRSYLQSDSNVRKITGYITKKVAEKLGDLYRKDRENYEAKWSDLGVFVKYGMITDESFYEKAVKFALFRDTEGNLTPVETYKDRVKDQQTDKEGRTVFLYTHNPNIHHAPIEAAKNKGYEVLVLDHPIDNHFMQQLEYKLGISFKRVDADTINNLIAKEEQQESVLSEDDTNKVVDIFKGVVGEQVQVKAQAMNPEDDPVVITRPEFMRRMKEMQMLQGNQMMAGLPETFELTVNTNHPLVAEKILAATGEEQQELAIYLTNLAKLQQNMLEGADLTAFVKKSLQQL